MNDTSVSELVREASLLAELINTARFEHRVPYAGHTVRLTELLAVLAEKTEGQ